MLVSKERIMGLLAKRRLAYVKILKHNLHGDIVLADLAKFCRAGQSTFHPDPRVHALLEGRKEVWTRIVNHLNLSDEDLFEIYQQGKNPGE